MSYQIQHFSTDHVPAHESSTHANSVRQCPVMYHGVYPQTDWQPPVTDTSTTSRQINGEQILSNNSSALLNRENSRVRWHSVAIAAIPISRDSVSTCFTSV
jgi:hypothetical protein